MSRIPLFRGVLPIRNEGLVKDVFAGITLAALGIPEMMALANYQPNLERLVPTIAYAARLAPQFHRLQLLDRTHRDPNLSG
jgi:hypothetical protein